MVFSIVNQQTLVSAANLSSFSLLSPSRAKISTSSTSSVSCPSFPSQVRHHIVKRLSCKAASEKSDPNPDNHPKSKRKGKTQSKPSKEPENENAGEKPFPGIIPKKPRRGRRSEAAAVEDYVRNTLERTLDSIRKQNPEAQNMQSFMKEKASSDGDTSDDEDEDEDESNTSEGAKKMVVEEEDPDWPLDTEVGWGIRASEYFDQHPIKNVVGEDGTKIDWEGEIDYGLVKEINCLEWESFAFHPSPLVVLVFERYKRASDNWRALKELEKAAEVYWKAKDRLPPRTVKIDINMEKDLAYALKVREGPQILFLRGNKILYRERDVRSADEFVEMIAYFYYNARKPLYINDADLFSPP